MLQATTAPCSPAACPTRFPRATPPSSPRSPRLTVAHPSTILSRRSSGTSWRRCSSQMPKRLKRPGLCGVLRPLELFDRRRHPLAANSPDELVYSTGTNNTNASFHVNASAQTDDSENPKSRKTYRHCPVVLNNDRQIRHTGKRP
jgi:hypothetical protein